MKKQKLFSANPSRLIPILLLAFMSLFCREAEEPGLLDGASFAIIVLPDTQFYSASMHDGTPEMFKSQTRWIVENRDELNIAFVTHLGDFVQNGDEVEDEWIAANDAMSVLDDSLFFGIDQGIPYGIAVGNHDQSPEGDADGTTTYFNEYFGASRFEGRDYYGGHFADLNDNHFEFFSAGGLDFIVIHIEYDLTPDVSVLDWADYLLKSNADRRAIVVTHYLIGSGDNAAFSDQGSAIYEALKDNANLFLMLGGHIGGNGGEGQRTDTYNGSRIYSLLSDYQNRENGGNGMLRVMQFFPENNAIQVRTYSPYADNGNGEYERDGDSEFILSYDMQN